MTALEQQLIDQNRELLKELRKAKETAVQIAREYLNRVETEQEAFERGLELGRNWAGVERGHSS